jgi:tetratricopeptide (TPR) repeat protein
VAAAAFLAGCAPRVPGDEAPTSAPAVGVKAEAKPRAAEARPTASSALAKALGDFNRGSALLEQYRYTEAAATFQKVLELVPDCQAARFNLALAYLNIEGTDAKAGRVDAAREALATILKADPDHLSARFCLGLCYQHCGQNGKALECFQAVRRRDPLDPCVAYKCGEALVALNRNEEGRKQFEQALEIDPGFVSAAYRLALQYQRSDQPEKAPPLFERFKDLNAIELTGGTVSVQKVYGMAGKYYLALGADNVPLPPAAPTPRRRVVFSPDVIRLAQPASSWDWAGGSVALPAVAAGDLHGDGHMDLCIAGIGREGATSIWRNDGFGRFAPGRPIATRGVSPCLGDVDNAGRTDLWLGTAAGGVLLQNDGKGGFSRRRAPGLPDSAAFAACTRLLDIDNDGDLDLLAFDWQKGSIPSGGNARAARSRLYENHRDGTFAEVADKYGLALPDTPVAAVACDDFHNDRDLDLVIFPADGKKPIAWVNDRAGKHHVLDASATGLEVCNVIGATSGDPAKRGRRDLLVFAADGGHLYVNRGGFRFEEDQDFRRRFGRLGGSMGQFADMTNDGRLDIVIPDAHRQDGTRGPVLLLNDYPRDRFLDAAELDPGIVLGAIQTKGDAVCVVADFCGKGRCDILLAPGGQPPMLIQNATPGGQWIELDLRGTRMPDNKARSNGSAIGARVEVRAGSLYQQYVVGTDCGPTARPPLRIHAGLGQNTKVEWLRIVWPDGVLQSEIDVPAGRVTKIEELPRKTSSCPNLFAWDGTHYQFVSDFAGVGGLGYLLAPGEYAAPRATEYLRLPHVEPLGGQFVLQVMEPLEEVLYLDAARLIAVDHPIGTQVFPNEMMAASAPQPTPEIFCIRRLIEPVRAVDHRGLDVSDALRRVDRRYAGATELDPRFAGFAKDHFVELDFQDRLKELPPGSRLILLLDGWVEYGYSSTDFAAAQAGLRLKAPSIHALRDGRWVELFHEVGYPAGLNHTMTLDVSGKILASDRRIRISSNMEIYWDRICLAAALDGASLAVKEVGPRSADLHFLGYPREYSPDGCQPNLYDYRNFDRGVAWRTMAGDYTRLGDVTELVQAADDCYVIMGPGEEVTLRFDAGGLGPIPPGRSRTFLLKADAYCKDMDPHTAYPDTVAPLPFRAMSGYPYRADEHYPDTAKTRSYRLRFNTRHVPFQGP